MVETQLCKLRGTSDIYTNYRSRVFYVLFERSEFLIDTPHKKNLRVCPRARVK